MNHRLSALEASAVVLTGTIQPSAAMPMLHRTDFRLRRDDYRASIDFYARTLNADTTHLVFIENSGADCADLERIAAQRGHALEVISYTETDEVSAKGKGAGEARMFERIGALQGQFSSVTKVTGRLVVPNLPLLVNRRYDAAVSCLVRRDLTWADTRLIVAGQDLWQACFSRLAEDVDESRGDDLERVLLARVVAETTAHRATFRPFSTEPRFRGISGTHGVKYDSPRARVVSTFKTALRRLPTPAFI